MSDKLQAKLQSLSKYSDELKALTTKYRERGAHVPEDPPPGRRGSGLAPDLRGRVAELEAELRALRGPGAPDGPAGAAALQDAVVRLERKMLMAEDAKNMALAGERQLAAQVRSPAGEGAALGVPGRRADGRSARRVRARTHVPPPPAAPIKPMKHSMVPARVPPSRQQSELMVGDDRMPVSRGYTIAEFPALHPPPPPPDPHTANCR